MAELLETQRVLFRKHFNWRNALFAGGEVLRLFMRGQTNFLRGMALYNKTYNIEKLLNDHKQPVSYEIPLPPTANRLGRSVGLYVHAPQQGASPHFPKIN